MHRGDDFTGWAAMAEKTRLSLRHRGSDNTGIGFVHGISVCLGSYKGFDGCAARLRIEGPDGIFSDRSRNDEGFGIMDRKRFERIRRTFDDGALPSIRLRTCTPPFVR